MEIRKVNPSDVNTLLAISLKTFHESFNHLNTPENMAYYMHKAFNTDKLFSELLNPFSEFYFAFHDNINAGYLKVNKCPAQSDIYDDQSLEIERIYIDSDYQGAGLGSQLLQSAVNRARELDLAYVWLGVWEKNKDAIRFYQRHGFEIFGSHPFVFGDEVQTDFLMKFILRA
ncbi:MAG TPA: GNAT family N-acetyltransferase [Saprospiraceae bacterium]|nr:GNAT family N-acetyltransferase [Saprospiraceae bacterium]